AYRLRSARFSCHIGLGTSRQAAVSGGRPPMQFILILVAVAAAMLFDVRASQAYQFPSCAGTSRGHSLVYTCSMRTLEQCVSEVIAGNRGFCNPKPYYRGPEGPPPRGKRKRYYYCPRSGAWQRLRSFRRKRGRAPAATTADVNFASPAA